MASAGNTTPSRKLMQGANASLLQKSLIENYKKKQSSQCIFWGVVNICLLSIILYDLAYTCPLYVSYVQYLEYIGVVVFVLNIAYHFGRYLKLHMPPTYIYSVPTVPQRVKDTSYNVFSTPNSSPGMKTPNSSLSSTPMNTTALSWMSNSPQNQSQNFTTQSNSWMYPHRSPQNQSIPSPPRPDTSGIDFINDEKSLDQYLKDFDAHDKAAKISSPPIQLTNLLSSFWSHPLTKNAKDVSAYLRRCQYQLSSPSITTTAIQTNTLHLLSPCDLPNYYYGLIPRSYHLFSGTSSNSPKSDDKGSPHGSQSPGMETWRRLSVDTAVLTEWNSNLRMWISQTILNRLIKEIANINEALEKQGLLDIQIGKVGLDRLRKTAHTAPVLQFIPNLLAMIPFLEVSSNQEYLVKRIHELGKGGCMSEFKWNSGSRYNGKDWDTSLPADATIIMHLFASYLDTQLMPLPSQPDTKPFSGFHYIKANEKLPTLTPKTLAIQQVTDNPPHHKVVIGEEVFELVKGYNNLFHTILLFMYYVHKMEHGMLGRVNLGRSGVNMLWIINKDN